MTKKTETVPKALKSKFTDITALTDEFSAKHLNDEYALLIRQCTAALCRKRPSPLLKGRINTWASGIIQAIGMVNFLGDPSQKPHLPSKEVSAYFGIGQSTGQQKSKVVRDALDMHQMDPEWTCPSNMADNPMIWMLSVDGLIIDIRQASLELQRQAYESGLIPYVTC